MLLDDEEFVFVAPRIAAAPTICYYRFRSMIFVGGCRLRQRREVVRAIPPPPDGGWGLRRHDPLMQDVDVDRVGTAGTDLRPNA